MHFSSSWMFINESPWLSQNHHYTVISSLSFKKVPFGRSDLNFISFFQLSCKSFPAPDLPNVCQPDQCVPDQLTVHHPAHQAHDFKLELEQQCRVIAIPNHFHTWSNRTITFIFLAKKKAHCQKPWCPEYMHRCLFRNCTQQIKA